MIQRNALEIGAKLYFPGMDIEITSVLGQGSNAIVYKGSYIDALTENAVHTVLIKELFPYHPKGLIFRNADGKIVVSPEANELFSLHKQSFERGNRAHLKLLEMYPEKIGGNVNTYEANGTLYTVLSESGGRDINASEKPKTLKILTRRMLSILDALSAFHESNLLHLDISPDNILLVGKGENERCMLIDYNSAFSPEDLYFAGDVYFSVKQGFTSPEVINKNHDKITRSSDLYSVAAVFFCMLMDRPLTLRESLSKNPPDVSGAKLLMDAPETVIAQTKAILKKGLCALPGRRYANIAEMREAFEELMRRIDMLGVTHAALWEAGKRNVQKLTRENPFYAYLTDNDEMFPVRLRTQGEQTQDMGGFLDTFLSEEGESMCVVSGGGMGKTTLLLKSALTLSNVYSPMKPAEMYISLAGKKSGETDFLLDEILKSLRFTSDTVTYDGARHQLRALLSSPLKTKTGDVPTLVLLLDGLNEATGDTALLYQEIRELSKLPGLRMLITSRAEDEEIRFARISLSELAEKDVEDALAKRGLLKPESTEIRTLLKTPLMLSVFLKASGENEQLTVNTEEDLLNAYIASLLTKEKEAPGDDEGQKYRIEAAVDYVLCALALKAEKSGGAISEAEAYEVVKKCRKTLLSKNLSRAFPMWIGYRNDIVLQSEDEFYGEIVHKILVRRMGLIVRVNGNIKISHARIGEFLAAKHAGNERNIRKRKMLGAYRAAAVFLILLAGAYFSYAKWLKDYVVTFEKSRIPYDDTMAEQCLSYAVNGYTEFGALYEEMAELLGGELVYSEGEPSIGIDRPSEEEINRINGELRKFEAEIEEGVSRIEEELGIPNDDSVDLSIADDFMNLQGGILIPAEEVSDVQNGQSASERFPDWMQINQQARKMSRTRSAYKQLYCMRIDEMIKTGEVVSWSKMPFDAENAKKLICLSDECSQVYADATASYALWVRSDRLISAYPAFKQRFIDLVKADAIVAVQLYQVVCAPHQIGSNDIWQPERLKLIAGITGMQSFFDAARSGESGEKALQDLANAQARREDALTALRKEMNGISLYTDIGGHTDD